MPFAEFKSKVKETHLIQVQKDIDLSMCLCVCPRKPKLQDVTLVSRIIPTTFIYLKPRKGKRPLASFG